MTQRQVGLGKGVKGQGWANGEADPVGKSLRLCPRPFSVLGMSGPTNLRIRPQEMEGHLQVLGPLVTFLASLPTPTVLRRTLMHLIPWPGQSDFTEMVPPPFQHKATT